MKIVEKRCFWYKVITANPIEQYVFFAYCAGKPLIWQMFLGWRHTDLRNCMTFLLSGKAINQLEDYVNEIRKVDTDAEIF